VIGKCHTPFCEPAAKSSAPREEAEHYTDDQQKDGDTQHKKGYKE
jgi:hypothetical protein